MAVCAVNVLIQNSDPGDATSELQRLRQENERLLRYESALRGSQVSVYTQDRALRYTSASGPMFGHAGDAILGCTDNEVFAPGAGAALIALKREVLTNGESRRGEVAIEGGAGPRWYDLHIEPLRGDGGSIAGLAGTVVDITERKEGEAHLRLLLRELTHRSKNLLAVIQAMARQTARHAGSTDAFLAQFGARLQALAASHDILVRESWYGASLEELVRSQLTAYIDRTDSQIAFAGPPTGLKPEAAQSLGLALHELAANAARFGALSVPDGRISIAWERLPAESGDALSLDWREELGPPVKMRRKKGFGSMVIERNLALAVGATVDLDFAPQGLHCRIVIPPNHIVALR
jgi:two-component sensor histidine kinase